MPCAEANKVQAYFDGELDAVSAAGVEQHLERCAECGAVLQDLEQLRSKLRQDVRYERAPPELRARIVRALDAETLGSAAPASAPRPFAARARRDAWRVRPFWLGAFGGFGTAALAVGVAFLVLAPANNVLLDELVSAHVRSLMPAHLIDVESADQHTVKPWFAGHTDVSPVVADFTQQGYRLIGGRADYFDHQRAAVVVYRHGAHVINVFSWAANGRLPSEASRNGYNFACWKAENLAYCAVSDTAREGLEELERLMRGL